MYALYITYPAISQLLSPIYLFDHEEISLTKQREENSWSRGRERNTSQSDCLVKDTSSQLTTYKWVSIILDTHFMLLFQDIELKK